MTALPTITFSLPAGVTVSQSVQTILSKPYPAFTINGPPKIHTELIVSVDGQPDRYVASWSDPYQPHKYTVYQPQILNAKTAHFKIKVYPPKVHPISGSVPNL